MHEQLPPGIEFNNEIKQKIIFGISAALFYLSSKKILIKSLNYESILFDDQLNPLLSDFEFSYLVKDLTYSPDYNECVESLTEPPEVYKQMCSEQNSSDFHAIIQSEQNIIFSWAHVVNSILQERRLYKYGGYSDAYQFYVMENSRPKLVGQEYPIYRNLIIKGFHKDPNKRPTSTEIILNLLRDEAMLPNVDIRTMKEHQKALLLTPFMISIENQEEMGFVECPY